MEIGRKRKKTCNSINIKYIHNKIPFIIYVTFIRALRRTINAHLECDWDSVKIIIFSQANQNIYSSN